MTDLLGTIMRGTADSTVEMRRTYRTAPQDLWEAVTSPERAARWLGELTGELHLVHSGLEHVSDTGHAAGWEVHLDQLAAGVPEGDRSDRWAGWAELQRRYAAQLDASR